MYLLYLDESYRSKPGYFVVGGLAVHEQDAWYLAQKTEQLSNRVSNQGRGAEFHASPMRRGKGEWHTVPAQERIALTRRIAEILTEPLPETGAAPVLFATALDRVSLPHHDPPYERAYEEFFARCNGFMGRLAQQGERHRCIPISDKSDRLEFPLQRVMNIWRTGGASTGANIGAMTSYAEVPLFVDSKSSRLVQLADFVAYWVLKAYADQEDEILQMLLPAFDQEPDHDIYGLVHLRRNYLACDCVACVSRQRSNL